MNHETRLRSSVVALGIVAVAVLAALLSGCPEETDGDPDAGIPRFPPPMLTYDGGLDEGGA